MLLLVFASFRRLDTDDVGCPQARRKDGALPAREACWQTFLRANVGHLTEKRVRAALVRKGWRRQCRFGGEEC